MKTALISLFSLALLVMLAGCTAKTAPEDVTSGMSKEEYQQMKEQSARMGMDIEDHMKMLNE